MLKLIRFLLFSGHSDRVDIEKKYVRYIFVN